MDDAALLAAVGRVEARGYYPAPLDMLSDELGERGEVVERELDRLAGGGVLGRHKQPDSDPAYSSQVRGGVGRG
jgi:hypothetical protein